MICYKEKEKTSAFDFYKIVSSFSLCKYAILRQIPPFIQYIEKIITSY